MNSTLSHGPRIRGAALNAPTNPRGRPHSRNKQWVAPGSSGPSTTNRTTTTGSHLEGERWERGGGRGGIRGGRGRGRGAGGERGGRKFGNQTLRNNNTFAPKPSTVHLVRDEQIHTDAEEEMDGMNYHDEEVREAEDFEFPEIYEPELETQEERDRFYQDLVKAREAERKRAIAEGKMDDPLVPKRLEDAITMVGTCMDMCPRFERYRRERENNLFEWETIPGTKRVDHKRAVKMYERAAGDKTLPSDLRPPKVLKRTLDYLFHDLLPRGGFSQTYTFIRDRSRSVRNDFTMQHESGPIAIECHDRCARFHILALHFERDQKGFSIALEEQQLMNTLQSLKEFYSEQRQNYTSPTELEMRVYHRLIHIRDQRERPEDIPDHITSHPVFKLTTAFRLHVQAKSAPITKTSSLVVDAEGMQIFGQLANVLREEGSVVMIYLVACILERLFGKDTIEDIEAIRGDLRIRDIIDGKTVPLVDNSVGGEGTGFVEDDFLEADEDLEMDQEEEEGGFGQVEEELQDYEDSRHVPPGPSVFGIPPAQPQQPSFFGQPTAPPSVATSAFAGLASTGTTSVFGGRTFGSASSSSSTQPPTSVFGIPPAKSEEKKLQPVFNGFGNGSAAPPMKRSLADAPPLVEGAGDTSTSPPARTLFGTSPTPFGSSPFQPQTNGTFPSAALTSRSSLFFDPPPPPSTVPKPQAGLFLDTSSKSALNPVAQTFKPSIFNTISRQPSATSSPTPPSAPSTTPAKDATLPAAPPIPSSEQPQTPGAVRPSAVPLSLRKSNTPPSLRIDTQSFTTPPPPDLFVPIPIPPGPSPQPLRAEPTMALDSPVAPPPLGRPMPISLPGTPGLVAPHPILGWIKADGEPVTPTGSQASGSGTFTPSGSLTPSGSVMGLGVLSPLDMMTFPSGSSSLFASPKKGQGLKSTASSQSLLTTTLLKKDKGKGVEVSPAPSAARIEEVSRSGSVISVPEVEDGSRAVVKPTKAGTKGNAGADDTVPTNAELKQKALEYRQRRLVSKTWKRWRKRLSDVIAWAEAVESSDAYRAKKLKSKRSIQSLVKLRDDGRSGEKRRRAVSGVLGDTEVSEVEGENEGLGNGVDRSPNRRRQRKKKRLSNVFLESRTDEEIAKRFKEIRAENQDLWAQGSYLTTIRTYVHSIMKTHRKPWNIWLSLNPESDSSAIWLERKFDVPKSGRWASNAIFEISLFPDLGSSPGKEVSGNGTINGKGKGKSERLAGEGLSTGLIVFECTPTNGVKDEIERKYCVLDDCSRLRDIIDTLSPKRRYIPSLLILNWNIEDQTQTDPASDLLAMVKKYVAESVLSGYATFGITTTASSDSVLSEVLKSIKLDIEGKLVRLMTIRETFRAFEEEFSNFLIEWLDNCSANGYFDWTLYGYLVQATIGMLNKMGSLVSAMLSKPKCDLLATFNVNAVYNSETAYDTAFTWLSHVNNDGDTEDIAMDLQSHLNIGQDFPARTFIQHLLELTVLRTEKHTSIESHEKLNIPLVDLRAASELFETAIQPFQTNLNLALNMSVRKRRGILEDTDSSPEAKRLKYAPSLTSTTHGSPPVTPSPYMNGRNHSRSSSIISNTSVALTEPLALGSTSASLSGTPPKPITVEMLRALTRDMKKKYGSPGKAPPSTPS